MIDSRHPPPAITAASRSVLALAATLLLTTAACGVSDDRQPQADDPQPEAGTAAPSPQAELSQAQLRASVPLDGYRQYDPQEIEAGRLDASWRSVADWDRQARKTKPWLAESGSGKTEDTRATPEDDDVADEVSEDSTEPDAAADSAASEDGEAPIVRVRRAGAQPTTAPSPTTDETHGGESWDDITPGAFEPFEPRFPVSKEDGGPTVLAVQQLLSRVGFSPGVVDGRWGKNTEKALYWLQDELGVEPTGTIDAALYERLRQSIEATSPVTTYRVTAGDVAGPYSTIPEDLQEQAKLDCLCYTSFAEGLADRFHTTPDLLGRLNPETDLDRITAGTELLVPDVEPLVAAVEGGTDESMEGRRVASKIAALVVSKEGFYLHAVDDAGRVLYHFPTTVGAGYDASPSEELKVTAIAFRPTFHYQPELFADVSDDEPTAMLPAGPNSPVGVVWMQLSKEHFGIHGTAEPATIGYTTSHGCIRLTNWDAQFLAERLPTDVPVVFRGEHPDDA
ncbi:MAG TPA: L,D-transpeptidase [Thermoanaerobaculia bacterium]|nr:L,D-transpeptidase [Thermoanaerobaculia bacterium]